MPCSPRYYRPKDLVRLLLQLLVDDLTASASFSSATYQCGRCFERIGKPRRRRCYVRALSKTLWCSVQLLSVYCRRDEHQGNRSIVYVYRLSFLFVFIALSHRQTTCPFVCGRGEISRRLRRSSCLSSQLGIYRPSLLKIRASKSSFHLRSELFLSFTQSKEATQLSQSKHARTGRLKAMFTRSNCLLYDCEVRESNRLVSLPWVRTYEREALVQRCFASSLLYHSFPKFFVN